MTKGIDISVAADTQSAMSAIRRGVLDPLEDVSEALEQLEKDSKSSTDDLEKGMRDAQRGTDRTKKEIDDLRDELKRAGRSGRDAGRDIDDGMDDAKRGVGELKDEANSTAREAAASFDGSAESIADAFQEIAANAFAGFGPAGAVAGLAAAAGIGLAVAGFEQAAEAEEESKRRAGEWAQSYVDAGGRVLTAAVTAGKALDIATDPERFEEAKRNAKDWGVDVGVAIAAMSGENWALDAAQRSVNDRLEEFDRISGDAEHSAAGLMEANTELGGSVQNGASSLERLKGEMQTGAQQADAYSRYLSEVAQNTAGAKRETDEFGDSVYSLPDGTVIYIDAETGQATTDTEALEKKIFGIQDKTVRIDADTSDADRKLALLGQIARRGFNVPFTGVPRGIARIE